MVIRMMVMMFGVCPSLLLLRCLETKARRMVDGVWCLYLSFFLLVRARDSRFDRGARLTGQSRNRLCVGAVGSVPPPAPVYA